MAIGTPLRNYIGEFVSMTLFVFMGTGAAVATGTKLGTNDEEFGVIAEVGRVLPIAMAFGLSIVLLAYSNAHLSGGHMNPAVTLTLTLIGECGIVDCLMYMLMQFLGAWFGSMFVWAGVAGMTDNCTLESNANYCQGSYYGNGTSDSGFAPAFFLGGNQVSGFLSDGNAFVFETFGTLLLCLTVILTAVDTRSVASSDGKGFAPLAIGFAVLVAHIVLIPFTGCGINPARTFGPDLTLRMSGVPSKYIWIKGAWVYYIGPICGALLAAGISKLFFPDLDGAAQAKKSDEKPKEASKEATTV